MTRRLFLSDIHMSAGWGLKAENGRHAWEWFTERDCQRMCWFLDQLRTTASTTPIDEIVFLGDIFDNWVFPHDVKPPTMGEILKSSHISGVLAKLDEISQSTAMLFLPGNHDMTLTHPELMSVLPRVGFGGRGVDRPLYGAGRILGEHGNAIALFCSPDPSHSNSLPLGYFISRIAATADRDTGSHTPSTTDVVRELGEILGREALTEGVFDAICRKARVSEDAQILMPNDLWGGASVSVKDVRGLYKNLLAEYEHRNGAVETAIAIPAELGNLAPVAEMRFARFGAKLVLMGHTHAATLQQHHHPISGKAAYVNSGCWCNDTPNATFIDVDKRDNTYRVSLMSCSPMLADGSAPKLSPLFDSCVLE